MLNLDPSRIELARHFDWYDGKLDSLFDRVNPTAINGLALIGTENISTKLNFFQALSRFYSSAVESDLPTLLNARTERLISEAAHHWSVASECCLVGRSGELVTTVQPNYVYPIYNKYNSAILERILFVYPERKDDFAFDNEFYSDSAMVVDYEVATEKATTHITGYTGSSIDHKFGDGEATDIGKVVYIRTGPPMYPPIESIVRELCVRMNFLALALNTTALPILQINKDNINDGELSGKELTLQDIKNAAIGPLGINLPQPFSSEEQASYVERSGEGLEEAMSYIRLLQSQLGQISSLPDFVFGVRLEKPTAETERVLFSSTARVNQFRRLLDDGLREFGIDVEFTNTPFVTSHEKARIIQEYVKVGILTVQEARQRLNIN